MLHEMSAPLHDARRTFPGTFASGHLSPLCERFREWPVRSGVEIVAVLTIGPQLTLPATFFRPAQAIASSPRQQWDRRDVSIEYQVLGLRRSRAGATALFAAARALWAATAS